MKKPLLTAVLCLSALCAAAPAAPGREAPRTMPQLQDQNMDWAEHGRIETGEGRLDIAIDPAALTVALTFTNTGARTLNLLRTLTGGGGSLYNDTLAVTLDGQRIAYAGPAVSFAPSREWYAALAPGETFINVVDLRTYYPFTAAPGARLRVAAQAGPARGEAEVIVTADDARTDWNEYGRINPGEGRLQLTIDPAAMTVRLALVNTGARPLNVSRYRLGDDGALYNNVLDVTLNGKPVEYRGEMMKIAMGKNWFRTVRPGDSYVNTVPLAEYYPFVPAPGDVLRVKATLGTVEGTAEITF